MSAELQIGPRYSLVAGAEWFLAPFSSPSHFCVQLVTVLLQCARVLSQIFRCDSWRPCSSVDRAPNSRMGGPAFDSRQGFHYKVVGDLARGCELAFGVADHVVILELTSRLMRAIL